MFNSPFDSRRNPFGSPSEGDDALDSVFEMLVDAGITSCPFCNSPSCPNTITMQKIIARRNANGRGDGDQHFRRQRVDPFGFGAVFGGGGGLEDLLTAIMGGPAKSDELTQDGMYHAVKGAFMNPDVREALAGAVTNGMAHQMTVESQAQAFVIAINSARGQQGLTQAMAKGYILGRQYEHDHAYTTKLWRAAVNIVKLAWYVVTLPVRIVIEALIAVATLALGILFWEVLDIHVSERALTSMLINAFTKGKVDLEAEKLGVVAGLVWYDRWAWHAGKWTRDVAKNVNTAWQNRRWHPIASMKATWNSRPKNLAEVKDVLTRKTK